MHHATMPKKYIPVALLCVLVCGGSALIIFALSHYRYNSIVVHHSASFVGDYALIKQWHQNRGWIDAAYHLILSNGSTKIPFGHLEATNRYQFSLHSAGTKSRTCNLFGLHLCIVGNYEHNPVPDELAACLAHALVTLQKKYNIPTDSRHSAYH